MSALRTFLAFAAAALTSSFVLGAALSASSGADPQSWIFGTAVFGVAGLLFTLPASLIFGVPLLFVLKALRRDTLVWLVIAGAVAGFLAGALFLSTGATPDEQREPGWMLLTLIVSAGACGGGVFGLVRGPRRLSVGAERRL